jgi:hypothetical protein
MARKKKAPIRPEYQRYLDDLDKKKKMALDLLRKRLKKVKEEYRLVWWEIADEVGCADTEICRFANTDIGISRKRLLAIEEFLDQYND